MKPRKEIPNLKIKTIWQLRRERWVSFVAVLALNLTLFLLLGSAVIYHFVAPRTIEPMVAIKVKKQQPPPTPPSHGGESAKSQNDPTPQVAPAPASVLSVVTAPSTTVSFSMERSDLPALTAIPSFSTLPSGGGFGNGSNGGGVMHSNPFGDAVTDGATPALVGYFYDLKQTSDENPQPSGISQDDWKTEMLKLVASNLNENVLSKYLKSPDPRSTGGFAIPEQASENAPDAFGLAGKVQPNLWAVVYHGKAAAPADMTFRFVGFGDDTLVVRADGQYVLDGGWQFMRNDPSLHNTYPYVWSASAGDSAKLRIGKWITVRKGEVLDLDILIGDWGGECGFFLLMEVDGQTYKTMPDGTPILPLFQIGGKITPPTGPETPPISDSDSVWTPITN